MIPLGGRVISTGTGIRFDDTECLSASLSHTDVSAVQLSAGGFAARLDKRSVDGWTLQFIEFYKGKSSCMGSVAKERHAFVVPLSIGDDCRLLGKALGARDIGVYAPGSEHADVSTSGLCEIVLTPPRDLLERAMSHGETFELPSSGSHLHMAPGAELEVVRRTLLATMACPPDGAAEAAVGRGLASDIEVAFLAMLSATRDQSPTGRLPRRAVLRMVRDLLREADLEPIHASELAQRTGVSYPTLRRIFFEWFGTSPIRYLFTKRLHLARRRLLSGDYATVSEAATSCGFWELGRFAHSYRVLFGELPSDTLKGGRRSSE